MDATYYRNNLSFLYESDAQGNPPVYGTDPVLMSYTNKDTFNSLLSVYGFLLTVRSADVLRESAKDVADRAAALFDPNAANLRTPLPESTSFSDEDSENDAKIRLNRPSVASPISLDVITGAIASEVQTRSTRTDLVASHAASQAYMRSVVSSVCAFQFRTAMDRVTAPGNAPEYVRDAAAGIARGFSARRKDMMFMVVADACRAAMSTYIVSQLKTIPSSALIDLNDAGFSGPFYYKLRTEAARDMVVPKNLMPMGTDDDFALKYLKALLVDLYIRTSFPLVHFDYIDVLMQRYMQAGDFVNARVALLAKITFVDNLIDAFVFANGGSTNNVNIPSVLDGIKTTLNNYITTLNTQYADTVATGTGTRDPKVAIMKRLQTMSSGVVEENKRASSMHESVVQHQITLKNLVTNTETMKKARASRTSLLWTLVATMTAVVIACAVLVLLKQFQVATYVASGWILALLLGMTASLIKTTT